MAGGQAVTSGQGSVGLGSRDLALTGSASTTATGIVDYSEGDILTGSEATTAAGDISTGTVSSVRLRSRKVGGGAASFLLTGAFSTVQQEPPVKQVSVLLTGLGSSSASGVFGKQRASLPTGIQLSGSTGSVNPQSAQPDWLEPLPAKVFYNGTPELYDLTQFTLNFNPTLHGFRVSPSLPADFGSMNVSVGPNFDGTAATFSPTNYTWEIYDLDSADWATRSTAAGVIYADRLETTLTTSTNTARPASNVAQIWADGTESHVTLDTSIKSGNAAGSQRITVLNSDGANSGSIRVYWGGAGGVNDVGAGETVWISFRVRQPAAHAYQPWLPSTSSSHKLAILSAYMGSNQANEVVFQQNYQAGQIDGYRRRQSGSGVDFQAFAVGYSSAANGSDIRSQSSVDRGANRLTGTNPDDGSAWGTNTWAQQRAQYGSLYSARTSPGAANYRDGFGDPWTGGFRAYHDEWLTLTMRVIVGTFGTDSSRVTAWAARDGQAYTQLWDVTNDSLGNSGAPAYNTIWLLPYATSRTAGGRRVTSRTNNITGAEILVCGNSTPVGSGTLTYTAATGRFTWAGNGETAGTARGYSAANDILILNVASGTATDSYLVIKVTPASLPGGNASDTITISDGRADTQINYNDVIVSTQAINAPGGFAPVG